MNFWCDYTKQVPACFWSLVRAFFLDQLQGTKIVVVVIVVVVSPLCNNLVLIEEKFVLRSREEALVMPKRPSCVSEIAFAVEPRQLDLKVNKYILLFYVASTHAKLCCCSLDDRFLMLRICH
jgi:hypothetical protein